ncbi:MAG TPA: ATP-binding protein [Candidatus Acidoferrum sp.]|nr:ATP-binding protein [Candidatus Acidoferrum sp.]
MTATFERATKRQARARVAITGPAGAGKTYTALRLAKGMGGRVALIDTEHGSASKYASDFEFDVLQLTNFHPERYVEAMKAAEAAGYEILVIDSASHEWNGIGGCLELVDAATPRAGGNSYAAWKDVTPLHNRFIEAIHASKCHVIATFRSKMEYVQGEKGGRKTVEKLGMAPVTRDGAEYEFDIVLDVDLTHTGVVSKSRAASLADSVHKKPGEELAKFISAWLSDGIADTQGAGTAPTRHPAANSGAPSPAPTHTATSITRTPEELGEMQELYALGESLPLNKQTIAQLDGLVAAHGFAHIRERLINNHKLNCGSNCPHIKKAQATA